MHGRQKRANAPDLSRFRRVSLAHLPTPLEPMARLSKALGGPSLYVKRDDCTGLATGGNKARKLEFLMAEALEAGADTVLTQGAVQSNHVRQTAAAAARLGLGCHVLLEERLESAPHVYEVSGNVLLDRLLDAEIARLPGGADMAAGLERAAETVRAQGRRPYVIPGGGSNQVGALGYVDFVAELAGQLEGQNLAIDRIVVATGSAGTQARLLAGLAAAGLDIPVHGIGVRFDRETQETKVHELALEVAEFIGGPAVARERVMADDGHIGPGYGQPTAGMIDAIRRVARLEGLLLDPVYSGKAMAGLIDGVEKGQFGSGENVLFIHTGGTAALFGYEWAFAETGTTDAAWTANG